MADERQTHAPKQPNIILILADDLGFSDIGCYGSEIRTPNLDALAAEGVRFTQAYNCARCCPSRAALLTGLYPHQAGIGHMVGNYGVPAYQGYLRSDCVTVGEVLRTAGRRTYLSGKWHVGGTFPRSRPQAWRVGVPERPLPPDRGFDDWYGTPAGAGSYFNPKPLFRNHSIIEPDFDDYYYTDAVTDHAMRMMAEATADERPFFLHVCYTAPHWPLHAREEDTARYEGRYRCGWDAVRTARHEELLGKGLLDSKWRISPRDPKAPAWSEAKNLDWQDRRMAVYAAQIDRMDQNIGRLLRKLTELGVAEDTMVIFVADNGGCAEYLSEDGQKAREWPTTRDGRSVRFGNVPEVSPGGPDTFQSYELPWAGASNSPFRLYKSWVHEGGISTPMIVRWPRGGVKNDINHEPLHFVDFLPTFIELTGATYPREYGGQALQPLEGESFLPALYGRPWRRQRPIFFEHEGNRAVRDGRWKLVNRHPGEFELYDMIEDRTELNDLSAKDPERLARMKKMYGEFAERCGVLPWANVQELHRRSLKSR